LNYERIFLGGLTLPYRTRDCSPAQTAGAGQPADYAGLARVPALSRPGQDGAVPWTVRRPGQASAGSAGNDIPTQGTISYCNASPV